jgi:hypothetical protein
VATIINIIIIIGRGRRIVIRIVIRIIIIAIIRRIGTRPGTTTRRAGDGRRWRCCRRIIYKGIIRT